MNAARWSTSRGLVWLCGVTTVLLMALLVVSASALVAPPEVPQLEVTSRTATTAMLRGVLDPGHEGEAGTYEFLYRRSATECEGEGVSPRGLYVGLKEEVVAQELSGLAPGTVYSVCLRVRNLAGEATLGPATPVHFTTAIPPAEPQAQKAVPVGATSAVLHGVLNPGEAASEAGSYEFLYSSTGECQGASATPEVASSGKREAVSAEANGLLPGTTYTFCLLARNGAGETAVGPPAKLTTLTTAPNISEEASVDVSATAASMTAEIDPGGAPSSYRFEYGPTLSYGSSLPVPEGDAGSGSAVVEASVHAQGLQPGTTYHFRVVVTNERGTVTGEDRTFTTQPAGSQFALPDGRMWEMVSPPSKEGARLEPLSNGSGDDTQAAEDGGGLVYAASVPVVGNPAGNTTPAYSELISTRRAPGVWETKDIATERDGFVPLEGRTDQYDLFSSNLSLGLVEPVGQTPLPPLPPGSEKTIYLREADGAYDALVTSANVRSGARFGEEVPVTYFPLTFIAATPDLSHVLVDSLDSDGLITPDEPGGMIYEWAEGKLRRASELPGNIPAEMGVGNGNILFYANRRHAISNDGSRIVLDGEGGLFLRDMVKEETVEIGASSEYATANSEGSKIFFLSDERLTPDSTATGEREHQDLYVYEVTSGKDEPLKGRLVDLTVDANVGESADVRGVIGASEDGSYVYFVANGVLGDGAERGAKPGDNLYMEHYDEATGAWAPPQFIATLPAADSPTWDEEEEGGRHLERMTSRVSPNGRYLAFMSEASLTGYDNRDAVSGARDEEVFLYDALTEKLVCASCDPTGARPSGFVDGGERLVDADNVWAGRWLAANIPGWNESYEGFAFYQSRYLSNSGRLFFDAEDSLVPADVNGQEDVYEYEPAGAGSCQGPTHGQSASDVFSEGADGCIGLISGGTSSEESAFLDASETGGDVFLLTQERLAPQDDDTSYDVYDAHECTASAPCAPPPALVPPPCTTGDACKPAPTPQPAIYGAPSSETFSGAGNITPSIPAVGKPKVKSVRCKKGEVKKHGVCVKRKPGKSRKSRKTNRRAE